MSRRDLKDVIPTVEIILFPFGFPVAGKTIYCKYFLKLGLPNSYAVFVSLIRSSAKVLLNDYFKPRGKTVPNHVTHETSLFFQNWHRT
jgi:hypothetical protein